ncbi:hypothetical protein LSPH26S_01464 [Lysinibacillus sphaericus]
MKIVENYPEAIRNAMGFNQENFFTILGFYSFPVIVYYSLRSNPGDESRHVHYQ